GEIQDAARGYDKADKRDRRILLSWSNSHGFARRGRTQGASHNVRRDRVGRHNRDSSGTTRAWLSAHASDLGSPALSAVGSSFSRRSHLPSDRGTGIVSTSDPGSDVCKSASLAC